MLYSLIWHLRIFMTKFSWNLSFTSHVQIFVWTWPLLLGFLLMVLSYAGSKVISCNFFHHSFNYYYLQLLCNSGIVQGYFAVASWLWTTVLSYTIFSVISIGAVNFKLWHARVFCWTLPMILALLPISTNNYGTGSPDVQWCLIVARSNTPPGMTQFWHSSSGYFCPFSWWFSGRHLYTFGIEKRVVFQQ